jgi:hypothetical protein
MVIFRLFIAWWTVDWYFMNVHSTELELGLPSWLEGTVERGKVKRSVKHLYKSPILSQVKV